MININLNELHLWFIDDQKIQQPELLSYYSSLLDSEEQTKQQRFHFEKDRHQYLITRSCLKILLSRYCQDVQPQQWQFVKNSYGKPYIANKLPTPLFFNLSHTKGKIVIAVSASDCIGVDIEYQKRDAKIDDLAKTVFSPEENDYYNHLPSEEKQPYFFLLWTLKEAFIKALGKGITLPMTDLLYRDGQIKLTNQSADWQFWSIESDYYQIALAAKSVNQNYTTLILQTPEYEKVNYPIFNLPLIK